MNVEEIWYQPAGEGVEECVSIRVTAGPKRFMRVWAGDVGRPVEWGWNVHGSARLVWTREEAT